MADDRAAPAAPAPATPAPDCRFKDLCLDAADPHALAAFWATVQGRELAATDDGGWRVLPPSEDEPALGIWVDPVPEPRVGKTRVHLDLRLSAADPAAVLAAGATVVRGADDVQHWWVLADPEGNVFCVMPPAPPEWGIPPVETPTAFELVVDSRDPEAQARWWAARLGGEAKNRAGLTSWWVEGAAGLPWMFWVFNAVPEPKTVKNHLHWDVTLAGDGPQALVDAGATLLRSPDGDVEWWVLADPEGNEFCAFAPH
jgi:predicted enzyme related to lactoylglutathione lyase